MAAYVKLLLNPIPIPSLCDWKCFVLFFLLFTCKSLESHEDTSENYLLCKYCGADAADLDYAFIIKSPVAVKIENQTFSGKEVVVQTLKNPSNIYFEVITVKKSNCIGYGEWTKQDSWFPGFAWKLCVCQPWGHFLGWVFEPFDLIQKNQKKASERGFYALNAENILTEQFSNSLLLTEEQQKFLDSLEDEFKDRFTENDKEFKAVLEEKHSVPPVVENWREFRQPDERYGNDRNYRNRDRDRDHDRDQNRPSYDRHSYVRNDNDYKYSHSTKYVHRYRS